jgi:ribonucleotide reductase beta subunit family protein with ferritin-like domain
MWSKFTEREIRKFRREQLSWSLSQFLHGEQGALLATAQIVDAVPWMEAKYYGSTQVMDEARHVETYDHYLRDKIQKEYPINPHLKTLLDQILTDSRWDMKYLGMQILVEGLAMAAFGLMEKFSNEPLLKQLTQYIMRDEARHVAFGVLSLETYYQELNEREMREREEFCYEGSRLMRDRLYAEEVWKEMNLPIEETREIVQNSEIMREFQKMLFSKIVPNVKRLGLLSPWLRERFHELDILKFEHDEPSA